MNIVVSNIIVFKNIGHILSIYNLHKFINGNCHKKKKTFNNLFTVVKTFLGLGAGLHLAQA